MNITIRTAAAVLAIAALAGCGASAGHPAAATPAASPAATTAPAGPAMTCAALSGGITTLVADQRSQDKTLQENWVDVVNGDPTSQGTDLQAAVSDTAGAASASGPLASDAATFNTDANTFLSDQSSGLAPGWPAEADAVKADIRNLAADCGIPHKGM